MEKEKLGSKSGLDLLPEELWGEIGKRVESRLDVRRFRSVCKLWRSVVPCPTLFPLNIPPPFACASDYLFPWFITENSVYAVSDACPDSGPEVVVLEEMGQGGKFLCSALTFPQGTPPRRRDPQKEINLLDKELSVSPLAKSYHVKKAYPVFDVDGRRAYGKWCFRVEDYVRKTVLISNCDDSYNPSYVTDYSDLTFVALSRQGMLTMLRNHGRPQWEWETFPRPQGAADKFDDIISHKGRLYLVDSQGMTFVMDNFRSMKMTQIGSSGLYTGSFRTLVNNRRRFVVEGTGRNGDLYLVVLGRENKGTPSMKVLKLVQTHGWLEVQSLEDQALFVGRDFSFTIPDAGTTISSNVINSIFIEPIGFAGDNNVGPLAAAAGECFVRSDASKLVCKYKKDDDDDNDNRYNIRGLYLHRGDARTAVAAAATTASSSNPTSQIISQYESSCWKNWVNYEDVYNNIRKVMRSRPKPLTAKYRLISFSHTDVHL